MPGAGELIAGAFLGLALQILHQAIERAKDKSYAIRRILECLESTIHRITPLIIQIDQLNKEADDFPKKVIEGLKHQLDNATQLVNSYSELKRRNLLKKYRYKKRIKEVEASLRWMASVDVQVNQWLDIKQILNKMADMNAKLDRITSLPDNDHSCFRNSHDVAETNNNNLNNKPETEGQSSHDVHKPKIDIHFQWRSQRRTKEHEFHFVWK